VLQLKLLDALNKGDKQALKDAVGDVFVTLVMVCETSGITMEESVNLAYDEIKDRKGFLNEDGIFIKEQDLIDGKAEKEVA